MIKAFERRSETALAGKSYLLRNCGDLFLRICQQLRGFFHTVLVHMRGNRHTVGILEKLLERGGIDVKSLGKHFDGDALV